MQTADFSSFLPLIIGGKVVTEKELFGSIMHTSLATKFPQSPLASLYPQTVLPPHISMPKLLWLQYLPSTSGLFGWLLILFFKASLITPTHSKSVAKTDYSLKMNFSVAIDNNERRIASKIGLACLLRSTAL